MYKKSRFTSTKPIIACIACVAILVCLFACRQKQAEDGREDLEQMSVEELESFVALGEYKNIEIEAGERTRGEAVRAAVLEGCTIKAYPEGRVAYYKSRLRAQFEYLAQQGGISFEELTASLGVSEQSIEKQAKEMAAWDVIYQIIIKKESIELTEKDKADFFDRYVEKYVSDGYDEAYVRGEMKEAVWRTMLHDKVTEFLIINNRIS